MLENNHQYNYPNRLRTPRGMRNVRLQNRVEEPENNAQVSEVPRLKRPVRLPQEHRPVRTGARRVGQPMAKQMRHIQQPRRPGAQRITQRPYHQRIHPRYPNPQGPHPQSYPHMIARATSNDRLVFISFLLPLIVFAVLFLVWPDEALSKVENRNLAQAPEFSWEKLFAGEFANEVDSYYSDQFPFRDSLIAVNRGVNNVYSWFPGKGGDSDIHLVTAKKDGGGQGGVVLDDDLLENAKNNGNADEDGDSGNVGVAIGEEQPENGGQLDSNTGITGEAQNEGKDLPEETAPIKEVKATEVEVNENRKSDYQTSNIVIINGQAMEIHYYSPEFTELYAKRINYLRSILPEDKRLISMVVPTAVAFYGTDELRTGPYSNFDAINNIYKHEEDNIYKVDAYSEIAAHTDEYIYFNTDHHWTGRGAYYAYRAFCTAMSQEATDIEDMESEWPEEKFFGSLYGYTDESPLLANSADNAEILFPKHDAYYEYYPEGDFDNPTEGALLYTGTGFGNHYLNYLGGDVPIGYIESEVGNGKSILIIKDSFGNAFIPFLIDNYEHIYVIDPRQYMGHVLDLIVQRDIQDVMVINYTFAVSNPDWLGGFDYITGYTES